MTLIPVATITKAPGAAVILFTMVATFIIGYLGMPGGMMAATETVGTPLLQLAAFSQAVLTAPVQLVELAAGVEINLYNSLFVCKVLAEKYRALLNT